MPAAKYNVFLTDSLLTRSYESGTRRSLFLLWSRSTRDGKKGRKWLLCWLLPTLSEVFLLPAFCPWKGCPCPVPRVSSLCRDLQPTDPPSLSLSSFPPHQKRAKSTNGNSATMLIIGSWPTGAWYIFSFIRVDYPTSYSLHPPSRKFPKLLVTLLFYISAATSGRRELLCVMGSDGL